jgi:hypothetical protein
MKNVLKAFGVIAIAAVIGFSMAACDDDNSPGGYNGGGTTTPIKPPNNHRYEVFENLALSWTSVRAYCESIGGHLVTITSEEEQMTVWELIYNGDSFVYWIGGYRDEKGNFVWVTGEKWEYTNWDYGEPNSDGTENCVQMHRGSGSWNDGEDEGDPYISRYSLKNTGFICEWD